MRENNMKRTIKNTIAVIGAIAMFSTTGAMLPSAEVYGAPAQTAAVLIVHLRELLARGQFFWAVTCKAAGLCPSCARERSGRLEAFCENYFLRIFINSQ